MFDEKTPEGLEPPGVGDEIFVPTRLHLSRGEDDFVGGLARVADVVIEDLGGTTCYFVEVEEDPGGRYNWSLYSSCVEGHCVSADGSGLHFTDGALDGQVVWPDGSPDGVVQTEAGAEAVAADTGAADTAKPDVPSLCPNPATAAGGYSGSFIDGAGGSLAKGKVTFTLAASTAQVLTRSGAIDGTALPGLMNYKIKGTLTGLVTCGVIASTLKGTLDSYAFDGLLNGLLNGKSASGLWNGQQAGGGLAVTGTWTATHN